MHLLNANTTDNTDTSNNATISKDYECMVYDSESGNYYKLKPALDSTGSPIEISAAGLKNYYSEGNDRPELSSNLIYIFTCYGLNTEKGSWSIPQMVNPSSLYLVPTN
jgi:hypothetical protein